MPSTFACLSYHIVFGTKHRRGLLTAEVRPRVFEYLGGVVRNEGGSLTEIGGVEDHVHLLVKLKPTHALADFVRVLKASSSKWINEQHLTTERFAWQEGYGAFTVSESQIDAVRHYLLRQEEHHKRSSLDEELRLICERHSVAFDPPTKQGRSWVAPTLVSGQRCGPLDIVEPMSGCAAQEAGTVRIASCRFATTGARTGATHSGGACDCRVCLSRYARLAACKFMTRRGAEFAC